MKSGSVVPTNRDLLKLLASAKSADEWLRRCAQSLRSHSRVLVDPREILPGHSPGRDCLIPERKECTKRGFTDIRA